MLKVILSKEELNALLQSLDQVVRAQGLGAAKVALTLAAKLSQAEEIENDEDDQPEPDTD